MLALYFCYFTFGIAMSFPGISTQFTMIEKLHFSPSHMTYAYGFIALPWCLKPLYGFITDTVPIVDWGKRRPYICGAGLLSSFLYVYIPHYMHNGKEFTLALTLTSLCICFADVCADSILVSLEKKETIKGQHQTSCWTFRALGTACGAFLGGLCYKTYGAVAVYRLTATFPFIMALIVWDLPKFEKVNPYVIKGLLRSIYEARMLVMLFLFISISPGYGVFYTYYLKQQLGYTPTEFSWINLCASMSYLFAVIFYKKYLLQMSKTRIIIIAITGSFLLRVAQLFVITGYIPYFSVVLLDSVAESFFDELIIMPLIILSASMCGDGVEATLYALLMSISNFSGFLSTELGGWIGEIFEITQDNFDNLFIYMFTLILFDFLFSMWVLWRITTYFSLDYENREEKNDMTDLEYLDPPEQPDQVPT